MLSVALVYLSELFVLSLSCPGRRSLRSASRGDYLIPHSFTAIKQNRAFSAAGPSIWNGLPFELRSLPRSGVGRNSWRGFRKNLLNYYNMATFFRRVQNLFYSYPKKF